MLSHYCSTATFHSIVSSRHVRLSSLTQSNDHLEGKLVKHAIAAMTAADKLPSRAQTEIQQSCETIEALIDGLGFCLSKEEDLLSQWRGYADDGKGLSISFSEEYLRWLCETSEAAKRERLQLLEVKYRPDEQQDLIRPIYEKVKALVKKGAFPSLGLLAGPETDEQAALSKEAKQAMVRTYECLYQMKSDAFKEELEWRLISYIPIGSGACKFLHRGDRLRPYIDVELRELGREPIQSIQLGPKHLTPPAVVAHFLRESGFGEVPVNRSKASYR